MHFKSKPTAAALAVSLAAVLAVAAPSSAALLMDDDKVVEDKDKKSSVKRTVRVVTSGKPVIIERKGSRYGVGRHSHSEHSHDSDVHEHHKNGVRSFHYSFGGEGDGVQNTVLDEVEKSLEAVNARLEKAKKKAEKQALEAAKAGLESARKALKERSHGFRSFGLGHGRNYALLDSLKDVEVFQGDVGDLRVEILDQMGDIRGKIADALDDVEVHIDVDDLARGVRVESLRRDGHLHKEMDEERLEALKRAEESIKSAREKLEKLLEKKKADEQKPKE